MTWKTSDIFRSSAQEVEKLTAGSTRDLDREWAWSTRHQMLEEWLVGGGLAPCNFITFQKQLGMQNHPN